MDLGSEFDVDRKNFVKLSATTENDEIASVAIVSIFCM